MVNASKKVSKTMKRGKKASKKHQRNHKKSEINNKLYKFYEIYIQKNIWKTRRCNYMCMRF